MTHIPPRYLSRLSKLRDFLRATLVNGFWFPALQRLLTAARRTLIGSRFNTWLREDGKEKAPAGGSELILAVSLSAGVAWVALLRSSVFPLLSTSLFRWSGAAVALYAVTATGIIVAYTIFVFPGRLHSTARSLASFLLNLIEVSLYSAVFLSLTSCGPIDRGQWQLVYAHLSALFSLSLPPVGVGQACQVYAHYELLIGGAILFIMVGSVIGGIARPEIRR